MAITKYEFLSTPVYSSTLKTEIINSSISIALERIDTEGNNTFIYFKNPLSTDEQTILASVVSSHDPYDIPSENDVPTDLCNKAFIHSTSKPLGFYTYFTSTGDDPADPTDIGGGQFMEIKHAEGDALSQSMYIDLNVKENMTLLHEGYVAWSNADFDAVTLAIVPRITNTTPSSGTYFNSYNGVIVPAAGDGTIDVATEDIELVEMTVQEGTKKRLPGYWNADYDVETHSFSNITAAPDGSGIYNMFSEEKVLNCFVNKVLFVDSGFMKLQSSDAAELGHGLRLKFTIDTRGTDHVWKAAVILAFHRLKTT